MDLLARNTEDLLRMVRELTAKHVSVGFVKERLTFSGQSDNPMATLMMIMLGGFAQFERSLICGETLYQYLRQAEGAVAGELTFGRES